MFNKIFASLTKKNGNSGIGLFLLVLGFITSLVVLYVIDVWLLSSVAAIFAAVYKWLAGGLHGHPNYTSAWWYFQHPLATARAWLGGRLSQPEVRSWWIGLNVFIAVTWTLRRIALQFDLTTSNTNGFLRISATLVPCMIYWRQGTFKAWMACSPNCRPATRLKARITFTPRPAITSRAGW